MNKRIDFTKLEGLAVYQDTLDFMQTSYREALAAIAALCGPYVIVVGVLDEGATYSNGWVCINGELLPFAGGLKNDQIIIEELTDTEVFGDDTVNTVYYTRRAKCGVAGGVDFVDFVRLNTIAATQINLATLTTTVASLAAVPTGTLLEFGGLAAPAGYLLCDGAAVSRVTYAALFAVIGVAYGPGDGATTFNVPDFKGKFPVGYDGTDIDYNGLGKTGGEKKHALTGPENGPHVHQYSDTLFVENTGVGSLPPGTLSESLGANYRGAQTDSDNDLRFYKNRNTESQGVGQSHENRPPFVVVQKIIKI